MGWDGMGWDLCAGLFYEHRFAMLIKVDINMNQFAGEIGLNDMMIKMH